MDRIRLEWMIFRRVTGQAATLMPAATAGAWRKQARDTSGRQPGDPVRAAQAIIKAVESPNPPHHLLLGNDAYEGAMAKIEELRKEFTAGEAVARGADFPKEKHAKVG